MKEDVKSIIITETQPFIKKVEMVSNGREGIKVTYSTGEVSNGVGFESEYIKRQHRPVQKELRLLFAELKEHLLIATDHEVNDRNRAIQLEKIIVTYALKQDGPEITDKNGNTVKIGKFMLGGKNIVCGDLVVAVNSAMTPEDKYEDYAEVSIIIDKIFDETKLYMKGKSADRRTVAIDYLVYNKKNANGEFDFDNMSKEEQNAIMNEANSNGLTVAEENGERVITSADELEEKLIKKESVRQVKNISVEKNREPEDESSTEVPDFGLPIDLN